MNKFLEKYNLILLTVFLIGCESPKNLDTKNTQSESTKMEQKTTASGLKYEIIKEGSGESPEKGKRVSVHYTGWLDDNGKLGTKFDSSVDRGQPFNFVVGIGQVIKGWDEGVMLMKVGEKRRFFIPSNLAYGQSGIGRIIPPNATLIFDVELLQV